MADTNWNEMKCSEQNGVNPPVLKSSQAKKEDKTMNSSSKKKTV